MLKIQSKSIVLFTAIVLASCGQSKVDKTVITFWAMGAEGEQIGKLVPKFEAKHPQIKVDVQVIPWNMAHEKILTAFAGDSNPDICQLGNTWIPEFQAIGALLDLNPLIEDSRVVQADSFFQGAWDSNILGGRLWGIPWYVDTKLIFYRTDILNAVGYSQPPQNWDEWLAAARKVKQTLDSKYGVFFSLLFNDFYVPLILVINNEGRFLKQNNCYGAFDDPATLEAFRYYLTFFNEGLASKSMTEFPDQHQPFAKGDFAMRITGPWDVGVIRRRHPELSSKWTTLMMPLKKNRSSLAWGASLVIFKNSENAEAAWKFIEFLSLPETQIEFFRLNKNLPSVRAAWNATEIVADKEMEAFYQQLRNVVATPKIAEWEQIAVKMQEHLKRVIYKEATLEAAMAQLNRDVDRILEKRRWLLSKDLLLTEN